MFGFANEITTKQNDGWRSSRIEPNPNESRPSTSDQIGAIATVVYFDSDRREKGKIGKGKNKITE